MIMTNFCKVFFLPESGTGVGWHCQEKQDFPKTFIVFGKIICCCSPQNNLTFDYLFIAKCFSPCFVFVKIGIGKNGRVDRALLLFPACANSLALWVFVQSVLFHTLFHLWSKYLFTPLPPSHSHNYFPPLQNFDTAIKPRRIFAKQ